MNPAQINARVVMSSQMFGIVVVIEEVVASGEIHVGAGLGQVSNLPLPNSNRREDAAAVGGP